MKSGLFGSSPSAIHATVTPAPVMPWSCVWPAWVVISSSASFGLAAVPQMLAAVPPEPVFGVSGVAGVGLAGVTLTFWSGTTDATAGLSATAAASHGLTVAANDATSL